MRNIEYKTFNEVINTVHLRVLEHGHLHAGTDWKFLQLSSPFNRLYFVIKGNAHICCGKEQTALEPGKMYLIPLNNTCDYICENFLHKFYVHFRLEFIPGHDLFEGYRKCESIPFDQKIVNAFIQSGEQGDIEGLINSKGILLSCISQFLKGNQHPLNEQIIISSKYQKLYTFIMENCSANLRICEIADYLNITPVNLSMNFKNDTGVALKKYIEGKVIQRAEEALLVTDKTIKEIAYDLEFSDESHFSKYFKNNTGMSPGQYRKRSNTYK